MTSRISVAMATYNGERYLQEQLDSLAAQTLLPCELVVGDDGSSDRTVAILEAFARTAPFPVRITANSSNLGYADNFLRTAVRCEGDWIVFCDQDDVWLPHKLAQAAEAIARHPEAVLILQNAELCGRELERTGRVFPAKIRSGYYGVHEQYGFWIWAGFLETIRTTIVQEIPFGCRPQSRLRMHEKVPHDAWVCMVANALGGIVVLDGISALYRRHDRALTGMRRRRNIRQFVSDAVQTGAENYWSFKEGAFDAASRLRGVAEQLSEVATADRLRESARLFEQLGKTQGLRADLYSATSLPRRLSAYLRLWLSGGYLGPAFVAMGWRSAAKDALVLLAPPLVKRRISA
jgi:glycosyltransferase involved in cell wall biosynthesis